MDNIPAKFQLQRLLQHEYVIDAQVETIKEKLPKHREVIVSELQIALTDYIDGPDAIKELTRPRFQGETVARTYVNMIPMENNGEKVRELIKEQIQFLTDDMLSLSYHLVMCDTQKAAKWLITGIFDSIQLQLIYLSSLDQYDKHLERYLTSMIQKVVRSGENDDSEENGLVHLTASNAIISTPNGQNKTIPIPHIHPPTFTFIARAYYSDAPYSPRELIDNCLSLIYDVFTKSNHTSIISMGKAYNLLRAMLWNPISASQFYLKDLQFYAILAPRLIAKYHQRYPEDLPVKFAHDCLKRTDFNLLEAEDLYEREVNRRKSAVAAFKQMIAARGGPCSATERTISRYLDESLWDLYIACERYDSKALVQQDKIDVEIEEQKKQAEKAEKIKNEGKLDAKEELEIENKKISAANAKKAELLLQSQQSPTGLFLTKLLKKSSEENQRGKSYNERKNDREKSFKFDIDSLNVLSDLNTIIYGEATGMVIDRDLNEGLDTFPALTFVHHETIRTLPRKEQLYRLFQETTRCVGNFRLQEFERERMHAHYAILDDWDNRNIPLTLDHPWFLDAVNTSMVSTGDMSITLAPQEPSAATKSISKRLDLQDRKNVASARPGPSPMVAGPSFWPPPAVYVNAPCIDDGSSTTTSMAGMEGVLVSAPKKDDNEKKATNKIDKNGKNGAKSIDDIISSNNVPDDEIGVVMTHLDNIPIHKGSILEVMQKSVPYEPNTEITKIFALAGTKPANNSNAGKAVLDFQQKYTKKVLSPLVEADLTVIWVSADRTYTPSQVLFAQYGGVRYEQEYLSRFNAKGTPKRGDFIITHGHKSCSKYILHVVVPDYFTTPSAVLDSLTVAFHAIKHFPTLTGNSTLPLRVIQFTSLHDSIRNVPLYLCSHALVAMCRQYLDVVANRRVLDKFLICIDDPSVYHIALRIACIYFPPPGYDSTKIVAMYEHFFLEEKTENTDHINYIKNITPYNSHFDTNLTEWYNGQIYNTKRFFK
jgi:hypothetical protein